MTLGEGKRKVLMLIDEYSSGGSITVDQDLNMRMADFFDLGQKNIATRIPPMEPMADERIAMPSAFVASPFCVMG